MTKVSTGITGGIHSPLTDAAGRGGWMPDTAGEKLQEEQSRLDALNLLNEAMLLTVASHLFRPFPYLDLAKSRRVDDISLVRSLNLRIAVLNVSFCDTKFSEQIEVYGHARARFLPAPTARGCSFWRRRKLDK